jgi:hypothetical protein
MCYPNERLGDWAADLSHDLHTVPLTKLFVWLLAPIVNSSRADVCTKMHNGLYDPTNPQCVRTLRECLQEATPDSGITSITFSKSATTPQGGAARTVLVVRHCAIASLRHNAPSRHRANVALTVRSAACTQDVSTFVPLQLLFLLVYFLTST